MRGQDWEDNVKGRILQPQSIDVEVVDDELLQQDWTTKLSEDKFGLLWVGHPRKGYEVRDPETLRTTFVNSPTPLVEGDEDYVRAIIDAPGYGSVVGRYGGDVGGISSLGKSLASNPTLLFAPGEADEFAELPSPAAPPNVAQLDAMRARLATIVKPLEPGDGVYLGEDWQTQGDWVGRYGRGHATLSGMEGGSSQEFERLPQNGNDHVFNALPGYDVSVAPGARNTYGMVSWISWTRTDNPRALFSPLLGFRRQSEWNDYGNELDVYPWSFEGPDLWVTVTVPAGVHRASLHFFNKDGQSGQNRYRDFPIELKNTLPNQKQMNAAPTLARARVSDFWGGVYQQFALCGPAKFSFKVRRNHSFGVTLNAVFLDPLAAPDASTTAKPLSWMHGVAYGAPVIDEAEIAQSEDAATVQAARELWAELDRVQWDKSGSGVQWPMRLGALRAAQSAGAPASLLANWRWQMDIWSEADRADWNETMARAFPPPPA